MIADLWQDLRFGARMLAKQPGFTLIAMLSPAPALGAQTANVLRLVIWQGLKLVLLGLAAGVAIGYSLKRLLANQSFGRGTWQARMAEQLYGVSVTDPLTVAVIALLLILVALLACFVPARRATKVDPMIALRCE